MLAKYLLVAAAVVGGALAQTKCDAKPQLDLCLQNMSSNVDSYGPNDAHCLCKAYKIYRDNCYTLCPKDPGNATNDNYISSWCISAGGESSSSVPVPSSTSTDSTNSETSAPSSTGGETEPSQTGSSDDGKDDTTETTTGTSTSTGDASTETGNAANGLAPAGVMLAAAAVMGLIL